jgi:hypothetical protein
MCHLRSILFLIGAAINANATRRIRIKGDGCELTKVEDSVTRNYRRISFPFYSVKSFLDVSVQTFSVT